jgi:hypothetical protein
MTISAKIDAVAASEFTELTVSELKELLDNVPGDYKVIVGMDGSFSLDELMTVDKCDISKELYIFCD